MPTAHFPLTARPPRVLPTPWGAAHTRVRHVAGVQGKPPAPLPQSVGRLQPVKAKPLRGCFASLDRFPAPSASVSFATPRRWRGVKGDEVVHFTLDALNRPNTHRRGRWIGFATCPCGLASESGVWGKAPRACFLFLKLLGGCNRSKKVKKCAFLESLLLKTPQIWPIFDPTPTLTGGE